jgi:hypothetical protein
MRAIVCRFLLLLLVPPGAMAAAQSAGPNQATSNGASREATSKEATPEQATPKQAIPQQTGATLKDPTAGTECPLRFSAQRYGLVATMRNTEHGRVDRFTQYLRLMFDRDGVGGVQSVEIVVHASSGKAQMMPLASEPAETATQTFRFSRSDGAFEPTQLVLTRSIPLVTRLELTRVEYTDGKVWREPAPAACTVKPSLFVLVKDEAH